MDHPYDIIIGLEIHVQLQTESKMFSWCGTEFGLPPNTQTDPVSLGLPGTLPVMNRRAFDLALKTAVALGAEIAPFTKWDRKNYYYPDLPKNYQISQYDLPFSHGGSIPIPTRKDGGGGGRCGLTRVHLEEDTGKLMHAAGGLSEVDLNRAGIPLLEIVSEPDIRSPADARAAWRSFGSPCATWAFPIARCRKARSGATPTSTCISTRMARKSQRRSSRSRT